MNAYFENVNTRYNSNRGARDLSAPKFGDGIISFVCAVVGLFTCPCAIALEKTAVILALFLSFMGVVGAIEGGALSMFLGIIICGFISFFEYAVLKSLFKPLKKSSPCKKQNA